MKPLLVAVVLLLAAPPGASAALDVYFQSYGSGDSAWGQVLAKVDSQFPLGGSMSLTLERGGQIIATSPRETGPIVGVVPLAGDRAHVFDNGVERAVIAYDGLPSVDGDCSPEGLTVTGAQTPGATLEAERPGPFGFAPERAGVTTDGGRYTATFQRDLRGSGFLLNSHTSAPALDGTPVGVHALRSISVSCARGVSQSGKLIELDLSGKRLREVRVDRSGRFNLLIRAKCPAEMPACRLFIDAYRFNRRFEPVRSLGSARYSVPGGTNRRVHGRIGSRALRALRRTGRRKVLFSVVIRWPTTLPPGLRLGPNLHGGYTGTLLAPR